MATYQKIYQKSTIELPLEVAKDSTNSAHAFSRIHGAILTLVRGIALLTGITLALTAFATKDNALLAETQRFEDGSADNGAPLYKRYCKGCHGKDGRGGAHTFMPHVHNLTKKDYIELAPDGYLYTVIAEGGEAVGKNSYMPAWKNTLTTEQIKDVIAYIRTMPTY